MDNILDHVVVQGQRYDIVSPTAFGDYIETIGSACINPDGYAQGSTFLARLGNEQFYYEATAAITQGSAILEGTNCKKTTVTGREAELASEIETLGETVDSLNEALMNEATTRAKVGAHNLWNIEGWFREHGVSFTKSGDTYSSESDSNLFQNAYRFSDTDIPVTMSGEITYGTGSVYYRLLDSSDNIVGIINSSSTSVTGNACKIKQDYGDAGTYTIKAPLLRLSTDADTTYQPYAMTNRELTNVVTASHSLGSRIDISSYNSSNNKYTCASDGYVYIQIDSDSNCTYLSALLSDGTASTTVYKRTAGSGSGNALVYVPKGMSVYFDCDNASPTKIVCRFIPIV